MKTPIYTIVAGAPAAGKTTYAEHLAADTGAHLCSAPTLWDPIAEAIMPFTVHNFDATWIDYCAKAGKTYLNLIVDGLDSFARDDTYHFIDAEGINCFIDAVKDAALRVGIEPHFKVHVVISSLSDCIENNLKRECPRYPVSYLQEAHYLIAELDIEEPLLEFKYITANKGENNVDNER